MERVADILERIEKSLESIDHSLKLIVAPKKIDINTASRDIEKMMGKHAVTMEEVGKPNAKRKMRRATCERCFRQSDWHYSEKAAKRELDNEECE